MTNSNLIKKIVFFDIDDTLFDASSFVNYAREQSFNSMIEEGLNTNISTLKSIFPNIYNRLGANSTLHYNVMLEEFKLEQREIDRLIAIGVVNYHNAKRYLINYRSSNLIKLLDYLDNKDCILGIISSGVPSKQWEKLYRLEISRYFDSQNVFIVEDKNTLKDSSLYQSILNIYKQNFDNLETFMIGDREDRDIIPAKDAGFRTIRYRGEGKYNGNFENSVADFKIIDFKQIIDNNIL